MEDSSNITMMNNRTSHNFRTKVQKPRQSSYQLQQKIKRNRTADEIEENNLTQRFSSEYMNIAKKFKIKMIGSESRHQQRSIRSSSKVGRIRVQTQYSRSKARYNQNQVFNQIDPRPQSQFFPSKSRTPKNNTMLANKLVMFTLNKNTAYNDNFIRLKTQHANQAIEKQESIKLNLKEGDNILIQLGNHCKKLLAIKQSLENQSFNSLQTIREIKQYVLRQDQHSVSKLDKYFPLPSIKKQIKQLILLQRMTLISLIINIVSSHLYEMLQEQIRMIQIILGFWFQIINNTYNSNIYKLQIQNQSQIKSMIDKLSQAKLLTKSSLPLLIETAIQKMPVLFKFNKKLYSKVSFLITYSQDITVNRCFYELLTIFATYLAQFQQKAQINLDNIAFFATCPSPYLVKTPNKLYTLVLDLDQTLLFIKRVSSNGKQQKPQDILYRPGALQFVEQLSEYYQIIIFTTSIQNYARNATKQFSGIDYFLFRQHTVRLKNGSTKDLTRIGRDLSKVIIIDDNSSNFRNQKDNGIKIRPWKGDIEDKQLEPIKELLLQIVRDQSQDVRDQVKLFKSHKPQKDTIVNQLYVE